MDAALRRLGTPEGVEEFRESAAVEYPDWDNSTLSVGWDRILISAVVREENGTKTLFYFEMIEKEGLGWITNQVAAFIEKVQEAKKDLPIIP